MVHLSSVRRDSEIQAPIVEGLNKLSFIPDNLSDSIHTSVYGSSFAAQDLPKHAMPEREMPRDVAYRLIKDDLTLDGNPTLNLASFVTTYMEDEAEKLMHDAFPKNFIDYEEYPVSADIQNRCVSMIARLYNCPVDDESAVMGTSTIGSSEAIMLATLAMKKRWQNKRKAAGKPYDKPNIVMNSAVQVCWEKAARYFDIEEKYVYCTPERFVIDPEETVNLVDENTIGICAIIGTTYTGEYEDVKAINDLLIKKNLDCYIHVDAASGGFVAPFVNPSLAWDFRLPRVISINVSGHKYGLVYPGVGWVVWRDPEYLPKELIFNINYLGADQASFTLNFSKGASQVIGQYYQLIRLGKSGYRSIMMNLTKTADYVSKALESLGFLILSKGGGRGLPLVAFRLDPSKDYLHDEFAIAHSLRERGWVVPAYTMAPHSEKLKLMRVVIREDFSRSRADALITDMKLCLAELDKVDARWMKDHMRQMTKTKTDKMPAQHDKVKETYGKGHGNLQADHDKTHAARSALIATFIFLTLLFLFKPDFLKSHSTADLDDLSGSPQPRDGTTPRIAKVSMLYGSEVNQYYVRALKSHRRHNERWNYGMHILQQDIVGGYWNKPSYLLSLVVAELAKPPTQRVEWFMWVDADLVLVNPAVPLEIFLPPPDFPNIKFLGSRDGPGLNSGTFFLKVCPWSVQMLAKSIGYPMFRHDIDLGWSVDQTAMALTLNENEFHQTGESVIQPRTWYNIFHFHEEIGTEWAEGDLLVHFPGLDDDRWNLMEKWLNKVERSPDTLVVEIEKTRYPKEVNEFWSMLRKAIDLITRAQAYVDEGRKNMEAVADSAFKVQQLIWDTNVSTPPGTDLMERYRDETAKLKELLEKAV